MCVNLSDLPSLHEPKLRGWNRIQTSSPNPKSSEIHLAQLNDTLRVNNVPTLHVYFTDTLNNHLKCEQEHLEIIMYGNALFKTLLSTTHFSIQINMSHT